MSEKIRRINRKSLKDLIQIPKKAQIIFLVFGSVALISVGGYFALKSARSFLPSPVASVFGSDPKPDSNTVIKDKDLAATICRGENCFWINRDGVAFGQSGRAGGNIVLTFDDKTGRTLEVDQQLIKPESLAELSFLRKDFSDKLDVAIKEGETTDLNLEDFDFKTNEGWTLKLTLAENAYKTVEILKRTLEEVKKTAPTSALDYMDLRIPNKVFYKFK